MNQMNLYRDQDRLNELNAKACEVLEDILTALGVEYRKNHKRIYGPCPVHGGDNPLAFNIFPEGESIGGIWVCHTHHCERKWKKTLIGFIHGMLSKSKEENISWTDAVDWLCKFLGYSSLADVVKPNAQELSRRRYSAIHSKMNLVPHQNKTQWNRYSVRQLLEIPSKYYIERGYSAAVLEKYDVGLHKKHNRIVVPIYDDDYRYVIGFTGRSMYPECRVCGLYHIQGTCPTNEMDKLRAAKWKHSEGFDASNHLYNYWFAKDKIRESMTIILTEGPGDCWKLEEAGIHNSVALFGAHMTDAQRFLIEQCGAMSAILMLDNDEAGIKAALDIKEQLGRFLLLYFPTFDTHDVGDLNEDAITKDIKPLIDSAIKCYK